ncbi:uncharacterized protein ACN427_013847 isoform 1-T1 [Glossina fuscipes fuscipes]
MLQQYICILVSTLVGKIINHPATISNAISIKTLHDTTRECLLALNNIGTETKEWDPMLVHILIKKLDRTLHIRFEQSLRQPKKLPSIDDLLSFLEFQFQTMETINHKERLSHRDPKTVFSAVRADNENKRFKRCNLGTHPLHQRIKCLQLSETDKLRLLQEMQQKTPHIAAPESNSQAFLWVSIKTITKSGANKIRAHSSPTSSTTQPPRV